MCCGLFLCFKMKTPDCGVLPTAGREVDDFTSVPSTILAKGTMSRFSTRFRSVFTLVKALFRSAPDARVGPRSDPFKTEDLISSLQQQS